jgi:hypothetical protein
MDPTEASLPPPLLHLRTETDPVSEMLCSIVFFRIPVGEQSPKTLQFRDLNYQFHISVILTNGLIQV